MRVSEREYDHALLEACFRKTDYFLPNEREAVWLTGETGSPEKMAQALHKMGAANCVIKLGAQGCYVSADGIEAHIPSFPCRCVDTTGADDTFVGSLLYAKSQGWDTLAHYILSGADNLGVLGLLSIPIQLAILYWERKSELSCDRAGSLVTSPEVVASTMARLSGGPIDITEKIDLEEWARQADQYDAIRNDGIWNKTLQIYAIAQQNHPFAAVRVREILKWGKSEQYQRLMGINPTGTAQHCPNCGNAVDPAWKFCHFCGNKLF